MRERRKIGKEKLGNACKRVWKKMEIESSIDEVTRESEQRREKKRKIDNQKR